MTELLDILLVSPPREIPQQADFPPLGLSYLSAMLEANGFSSRVIDGSTLSWKQLKNRMSGFTPATFGIPCWTVERGQSFELAKMARQLYPKARILMGGHHSTALPHHIFSQTSADAVVRGEGEATVIELVEALIDGNDLSAIKGISYRQDDECRDNDDRGFIADLDTIPFPDYRHFDLDRYLGLPETIGRAAAIITSRGCPHKCIYCSASRFWKRKWRYRSAENVLDEIEQRYRDHGVRNFIFFDDNFTIKKERVIDICRGIILRGLDINWVAESHVNNVNEEILSWLKKSGCYRIDYGVESGSPQILANIKKGHNLPQIEKAFSMTHEAGIMPRAYLMVGNPGECESTIQETVDFMKKIKPHDAPSGQILWVLPDTEIYELAKKNGAISEESWLESNSMFYYTGEHSYKELKRLRNQLMRGLARNRGSISSYTEYLARKIYYRLPALQRLRKARGLRNVVGSYTRKK